MTTNTQQVHRTDPRDGVPIINLWSEGNRSLFASVRPFLQEGKGSSRSSQEPTRSRVPAYLPPSALATRAIDRRRSPVPYSLIPPTAGLPRPVHPEPIFGALSSGDDPSPESGSSRSCASLLRTAEDGTAKFASSLSFASGCSSLYSAILLSAWHSCVGRQ